MNKIKLKVGITGNIGSGKSTFAKFLSEKRYPVIQADEISKEILLNDPLAKKKIIKEFGANTFQGNIINTRYLSEQVFSDIQRLKKINSILHPLVRKKIDVITAELFRTNDIVFIEAALIFESKLTKMFDYIVLITSEMNVRLNRAMIKNKLSEKDFSNRNKNQIDDKKKIKNSDFVFTNNGSLEELKLKADLLLSILKTHPY